MTAHSQLAEGAIVLPAADWSKPVVWLSTAQLSQRREVVEGGFGGSFVNPVEAQEIRRLVGRIDFYAKGRRKSGTVNNKIKIVILTGYAAQRRRIESLLAQDRGHGNASSRVPYR